MAAWEIAVEAARAKKAEEIVVLELGAVSSFTDYFIVCSGSSSRQTQAIADSVEEALRAEGRRPLGVEGRQVGEWILMDYGELIVHVFSPEKREFYNLERLWSSAPRLEIPQPA